MDGARLVEAGIGLVWIADASKGGQRWVVRPPTPDQAFAELRASLKEDVLKVELDTTKQLSADRKLS